MDLDFLYSEYVGVIDSLGLNLGDHVMIASVTHQTITHFQYGKRVKAYVMSSSKRPPSCVEGSLGTPCGLHEVCEKIGEEIKIKNISDFKLFLWSSIQEERFLEDDEIITDIFSVDGVE